jgi:hypothetical protein
VNYFSRASPQSLSLIVPACARHVCLRSHIKTPSPCLPYHCLVVARRLVIGLHRDGLYGGAGDGARTRRSACLEGRRSRHRRSIGLHRPYSRFHTVYMQCERAGQKMSRAFFTPFGKTCHVFLPMMRGKSCCEHLEAGGHAAVHIIPSLYYLWQYIIGNTF